MMAFRMMLFKVYFPGYFFAVAMSNQTKKLGDYPHGIARQIDNKIAAEQFKKLYIDKDLTDNYYDFLLSILSQIKIQKKILNILI